MSTGLDTVRAALANRYRIKRELGAGGMATVYLATDLKHERQVAIKVLKPDLAAVIGAERFLAEIKTTANLQHPHILPLHDSGEADSLLYFVMPFIEGESLRDRLSREKQLPIDESIEMVEAVASALDYAHRQWVIHRDIKPENILLQDGQPVVADFGIALAVSSAAGARLTETGLSLGTPQYMSPEQAMGDRDLDRRTDVYSLACVLHEMLLGDPPYTGSTAQAIVSRILTGEPASLTARRATIPPHIDAAVRKALARIPADRFSTAEQFAEALTNPALAPPLPTSGRAASAPTGRWKTATVALAGIAAAAIAIAVGAGQTERTTGPAVYDVGLPDSVPMAFKAYWLPAFSASPDGSFLVYVAQRSSTTQLWFRSLLDDEARPIRGTEGATAPVVSPDGARVAFKAGGQLKVVPIEGGVPTVVADITDPAGILWLPDGQILVADHDGNLLRWLDPDAGELRSTSARHCVLARPLTLGDPNTVICGGGATQFGQVIDLDEEGGTVVIQQDPRNAGAPSGLVNGSDFRLLDDRHLTYLSQEGELRVVSLDTDSLSAGRPVTMVRGVRREGLYGAGQYDVTASGTLVYAPGANAEFGRLVHVGEDGQPDPLPMEPAAFLRFDLSPDGRTLAAVVRGVGQEELRIYDMATGEYAVWQRGLYIGEPQWEPSGDRLVVLLVPLEGPPVTLLGSPTAASPPDTIGVWGSPVGYTTDGRLVVWVFDALQALAIDLSASPPAIDTLATSVYFPSLSPDDRWLAYQNRATGQLFLEPHPSPDRRYHVADEAWEPRWRSPTELVYWIETTWYRVTVAESPDRPLGKARSWFTDPRFADTLGESYLITPDGGVIYVQGPESTTASYLRVVPNWVGEMKRAVAGAG